MSSLEIRPGHLSLPDSGEWEYGGYPYGLEPLTLPPAPPAADRVPRPDSAPALREWRSRPPEFHPAGVPPEITVDPRDPLGVDRLFWFRWITGHQVTFVLWRLLAAAARGAEQAGGAGPDARAAERARRYVRGYSLMLLYTSSCPREVYNRLIRPSLALQHRHLSGSWAQDFHPVRSLLRGRIPAGLDDRTASLREECRLNQRVHEGIAAKLVPSGVSLLQRTAEHEGQRFLHRDLLSSLYDCVFLTVRAPLAQELVVTQLARRLHAIRLDLLANGLYPGYASSSHEESDALRDPSVARCKRNLLPELSELCGTAVASLG
ncbi:L-tyrosine 3-hydroxylase [Streptomyces sp. CAU 1734]|uniref:L-tyrosine 3-hydroxylase n=1 Tax=Streptomyces sp. CAU 1734 TaxID=3140360 RepID=UPI003260835F